MGHKKIKIEADCERKWAEMHSNERIYIKKKYFDVKRSRPLPHRIRSAISSVGELNVIRLKFKWYWINMDFNSIFTRIKNTF